MVANGGSALGRRHLVASALAKHFALDHNALIGENAECDFRTYVLNILKTSRNGASVDDNDEVTKWITFADSFPVDSKACFDILKQLNEELAPKSVLLGKGLKPSEADVLVFSVLHPYVIGLSNAEMEKLPHVLRWMDYIQNKQNFGELFQKILLQKCEFNPPLQGNKVVANNVDEDSNAKKSSQSTKVSEKPQVNPDTKKTDVGKKEKEKKEAAPEKKKPVETETPDKEKEVSVSLLNIKVGLIRKAWKHPSADSLLVEEIDVGEAKVRQVVSGLAKYCSPEELTNRHVVLITNVKPGKLRDVMSEGLVLCASNEDHTVVEPLLPPKGAKIGEQISFSGVDGKPEDVLNPKKKQLDKITPHLFTNDKGEATFKGIPFMTSAGPCTSSISKGSIK
ncbi:aminoacyl tRNA synthase complex-interacting multifunctional protein 1 isoform X1 [Cucumis melo var. makuwa]|uniref:Aminoacyl tRNA synthase complex-interacting multifunctional protein 1 isoform X1 n=1 Tax=Cucumis melo var. makuwa TaxID=1194695 RepID=A0A5A7VGZ2_CUCMM|nr:aminoacyl tRNA synthase complex-interacting multifunctional protein 1 isoform X1 [Cucumis melo var. makuwa]